LSEQLVTTPSYAELVTAVRREGEGIHTAASLGCDPDVPACSGWTVRDLVRHVVDVYGFVTEVLTTRATDRPERPAVPAGDPAEVFEAALDGLVSALQAADADTPVWNWTVHEPHLAGFWARRMAHESSVHRFDAQAAHGVVQPIDAELASDGIDELIDVIGPRVYLRDGVSGPTGTVTLASADDGSWHLMLEAQAITRLGPLKEPEVTARGTTSALLLALYSRIPWTSLETTGNVDLLTTWTTDVNF
jgi:uncharacterized protein (TIGR03083 family)